MEALITVKEAVPPQEAHRRAAAALLVLRGLTLGHPTIGQLTASSDTVAGSAWVEAQVEAEDTGVFGAAVIAWVTWAREALQRA